MKLVHVAQAGGVGADPAWCSGQSRRAARHAVLRPHSERHNNRRQQAAPGAASLHIVVRDQELDLGGGILVSDLQATRAKMMNEREAGCWPRRGRLTPRKIDGDRLLLTGSATQNFTMHQRSIPFFGGDTTFVQWRGQVRSLTTRRCSLEAVRCRFCRSTRGPDRSPNASLFDQRSAMSYPNIELAPGAELSERYASSPGRYRGCGGALKK